MVIPLLIMLHGVILLTVDRRNIISPLNAVLIWLWIMVFRASEVMLLGQLTLPDWAIPYMTDEVILNTLLVIGLFLMCFLSGYLVPVWSSPASIESQLSFADEAKVPKLFIGLMALVGIIVLIELLDQLPELFGVVYLSQGDPGEFFEGKGLLITGLSLLPSAVVGLLIACRTAYGFAFSAFLLLCITFVVYAPLGQRGNIFTFVILALSLLVQRFPIMKLRYLFGIGFLVFVGMASLVLWRTAIRFNSSFEDILSDFYWFNGTDRGDFEALAGVVAYKVSIGYDSWWSFVEQLIPRSLFPSKHGYVAVSYLMNKEIVGEDTAGLTTTIIGTLLAQGGFVTVVIGGLGMGMFVRVLQNISIHKVKTPNRSLLAGMATAFILLFTRNGDITNVVIMLISNLAGVFLLMAVISLSPLWERSWREVFGRTHYT